MLKRFISFVSLMLLLTACQQGARDEKPAEPLMTKQDAKYNELGKLFGDEAFVFGGDTKDMNDPYGIGVNSFLWRASLDTVSFIPLQSADPFGGVILTDWYSSADTPNERLKINIFILGRSLRTDGVRAKIFKQVRHNEKSEWKDVEVSSETVLQLEDTILTRARQLRVAAEG